MSQVLSIDTAMGFCSAGVYCLDQGITTVRSEPMTHGQAERLVPLIQEVLDDVGVPFAQIASVVTTIGPGAFTGLRVGLSSAKAFGLSLDIPVYGVSTLQALAFRFAVEQSPAEAFCVVIETRRDDFYVQGFDCNGLPQTGARLLSADRVRDEYLDEYKIVLGDAVTRLGQETDLSDVQVHKDYSACDPALNAKMLSQYPDLFSENPEALYLRGADVSQPKKQYRHLEKP